MTWGFCRPPKKGTKYSSSDHDPLYRFHQWEANLRILGVTEIKAVPYAPLSHPFSRATYRHDSPRVFRPHLILDHSRSGGETAIERMRAGRAPAGTTSGRTWITNWSRFVPVAEALPKVRRVKF